MCQHEAMIMGWLTLRRGSAVRLYGFYGAYDRLLGLGVGG
jgi:hypothetical protein